MAFKKLNYTTAEYVFDHNLFKCFLSDLGIKRKVVLEALSIPPTTWDGWRKTGIVPTAAMKDICNVLYIPISRFITFTGAPAGKVTVDMQWESDTFTPIEYKPNLMGDYLTLGRGKSVDEACADLGVHPHYFYQHFRSDVVSRLPFGIYLKRCNMLRMWPGNWLIDNNEPIVLLDGYEQVNFSEEEAQKIRDKIEDTIVLKRMLRNRDQEIADLKRELEMLRSTNAVTYPDMLAAEDKEED